MLRREGTDRRRPCVHALALGSAALLLMALAVLTSAQGALAASEAQLWASSYNGPGNGDDYAHALGVSPDGSKVFVTGGSSGSTSFDYATVAYDASSGAQLWRKRYSRRDGGSAWALGVSPDGSKVFVTGGSSTDSTGGTDYGTVAYDAASGAKLWAKRYNGPGKGAGNGIDAADALGVSPDGSKVFVTGRSSGGSTGYDYATVAYDASSGEKLWVKRYDGPAGFDDSATALGVSPDGSKVVVTGWSGSSSSGFDYATVAYDASSGAKLWATRYSRPGTDDPWALGVSPDSSKVFVTGSSTPGSTNDPDYATVAYDTSSGAKLWGKRYNGPGNGFDSANALDVSPDGSTVFVTGDSSGSSSGFDYATMAYDASSGAQVWRKRYNGPGNGADIAKALGLSADGSKLFVSGYRTQPTGRHHFATFAYDASSGSRLWLKTYNGPGKGDDEASALGLSPDGSKLFVTGRSVNPTSLYQFDDYATVAYNTG